MRQQDELFSEFSTEYSEVRERGDKMVGSRNLAHSRQKQWGANGNAGRHPDRVQGGEGDTSPDIP